MDFAPQSADPNGFSIALFKPSDERWHIDFWDGAYLTLGRETQQLSSNDFEEKLQLISYWEKAHADHCDKPAHKKFLSLKPAEGTVLLVTVDSSASDLSCGRSQQFHHLINTLLPQKAYVEAVLKKSQIGASWWRNDVELDFSVEMWPSSSLPLILIPIQEENAPSKEIKINTSVVQEPVTNRSYEDMWMTSADEMTWKTNMGEPRKAVWKNLLNINFKIGGKDSRQSILAYDDAVKRIPDQDLIRLKKAFRKDAISEHLPKTTFISQVMGDSVPRHLAETMFVAFGGGSRGITLKDLIAGLVLLSCGTADEKLAFIFHLCSGGCSSMPMSDLIAMIKISEDGKIPEHVVHAFAAHERISAEQFRAWINQYWSSMALTRWLLENDFKPELISEPGRDEIPTFYQTLAGVTHLEEKEIFELEKFYGLVKSRKSGGSGYGRYDVSFFASLVSPPVPSSIVVHLFQAFDENCDGHLDLKEIVCGVSACCRGPMTERLKFLFKVFDIRRKKQLAVDEVTKMLSVVLGVDDESVIILGQSEQDDLRRMAEDILEQYSGLGIERFLTLDQFLKWALKSNMTGKFQRLLFQVCHVVLGLRPQNKEDELACVTEWLQRDCERCRSVGDVYYVVSMEWWRNWRRYMEDAYIDVLSDNETPSNDKKRSNAFNERIADLVTKLPSRQSSRSSTPTPSLSRSSSTMSVQSKHPGPINTQALLLSDNSRFKSITDEGGVLRRRSDGYLLRENDDYILVCEAVWKVLSFWYHVNGPELPRQCVRMETGHVRVDVFPVCLKLWKHKPKDTPRAYNAYPYGGMVSGSHAFAYMPNGTRNLVERVHFANACFSSSFKFSEMHECFCRKLRLAIDDVRLWIYVDENNMSLIYDESVTIASRNLKDFDQILIETRNKDLTWPEELTSLSHSSGQTRISRSGSISRESGGFVKGCCGLNNLGNTCFMNSALQCVSYSRPLTYYFHLGTYGNDLNRSNPIGYGGLIAERYAELVGELWSGKSRTVAPVDLRKAIGRHRAHFNGYQQHDSQELLAFLLDGLHEDLNRVHDKPYVELNDSQGRKDAVVAQEAWENHLRRNQSIVVDLFHGLLKSRVKCLTCTKSSVRFDPFSVLSLPLPLDNLVFWEFVLVRCDGCGPIKYGLRVDPECSIESLRLSFAKVCALPPSEIIPVDVKDGLVKRYLANSDKAQGMTLEGRLLMYQMPMAMPVDSDASSLKETDRSRWIVAIHRRFIHNDSYYLSWSKAIPRTFGLPVLVCCHEKRTIRQLYDDVWMQIKRFIGPETSECENSNHAQECDVQNGGYSFTLRLSKEDGCWCSVCPWYRFCRGCPLIPSDQPFSMASDTLVIDWEPAFYHLRYQESLEFMVEEDESVRRARQEQQEPISLDSCFKAFTHEEQLAPDALYQCSRCHKPQLASKRMQLWKLPPVLALHLKRFQKVRDHWVKSHKVVTFPINGLDLSSYLAAPDAPMTPVTPLTMEKEENAPSPLCIPPLDSSQTGSDITSSCEEEEEEDRGDCTSHHAKEDDWDDNSSVASEFSLVGGAPVQPVNSNMSTSMTSASADASIASATDLKYDLYAICCHSGLLATGHYVAYCKNPNGKWYLFNDSSCKEIAENQLDTSTAYMLFYERKDLEYRSFIPQNPSSSSPSPSPSANPHPQRHRHLSDSLPLENGFHRPPTDPDVASSQPDLSILPFATENPQDNQSKSCVIQ